MSRLARISIGNVSHHVTQRGNAGQFLLHDAAEKAIYHLDHYEVSILGYCIMSNHVHLVLAGGPRFNA